MLVVVFHIAEYPRVAPRTSSYHKAVTVRLRPHVYDVLRSVYIAIANDRDDARLLHPGYDAPVRMSLIILLPCPSVHRHSGSPALLGYMCYLRRIYML